jgi:hypothetical protein
VSNLLSVLKKILRKDTILYIAAIGGAFMVLLALGYFISSNSNYRNEWQLFKTPEKVAELYFTDHTRLPAKYVPGEVSSFSFTVVDTASSTTADYRYEVIQENAANTTREVLKSGTLTLSGNQPHTEKVTIRYTDGGPRSKIVVRLPDQSQSIHYWVERQ